MSWCSLKKNDTINRCFERWIASIILLNIIAMALHNNTSNFFYYFFSISWEKMVIHCTLISQKKKKNIGLSCHIFYSVEICLKIIAFGFFCGPKTYLRNYWNILDFLVVICGIVDLLLYASALHAYGIIRLIQVIPSLFNTFMLLFCLFLIWGLIGLQLFRGKFSYRCQNEKTMAFDELSQIPLNSQLTCGYRKCPEGYSCVRIKVNPFYDTVNFDNLPMAILTIFCMVTMEQWADTMYRAQDSVNFWVWPYFVIIIVVGGFLVINLALVAVSSYLVPFDSNSKKEKDSIHLNENKNSNASVVQQHNDQIQKNVLSITENESNNINNESSDPQQTRYKNTSELLTKKCVCFYNLKSYWNNRATSNLKIKTQNFCSHIIVHPLFNAFFVVRVGGKKKKTKTISTLQICIIVNTILLSSEHYGQSMQLTNFFAKGNIVLTALFSLEMVLKIWGKGIREYMADLFDLFDSIIVVSSLTEVILQTKGDTPQ
ncbi:voltage-dependent L-type calcium channel subunit alpha-1D isoform 1 [Reticulomyxa filosa]|uniref:Voltage-dependent L-type calcium channel subunit alpha-1D isoform 1 n=1 Tax=Reticulomyxa filosa TaxID=46433 RepID=X6MTI1_RETFI|nr:voltage-dependent L-type calcium channel subunit alpha-1D isoform 1 [Reticulomyxa filosa]|eukprot:ETO16395.1 voltage-dependent L-type calcium channel subunit alpha-1D isoform 1 [Reticulomyxa filosa]